MPPSRPLNPTDPRLVGCRYGVPISLTRFAVSCPDTQRIVICDDTAHVVGASAALTYLPGAIGLNSTTKLWTVDRGGQLLRLSSGDTPAVEVTTNINAVTSTWIAAHTSVAFVAAPGRTGTIVSVNSSGAVVDTCDSTLSKIQFAIGYYSAPYFYIYCFDGIGLGAIIRMTAATGLMVKVEYFNATDCQTIEGGFITGTTMVLAVSERPAVCVFSLASPEAPTRTTRTLYSGYTVTGVVNDGSNTPTTKEPYGTAFAEYYPLFGGMKTIGNDLIYFAPASGRLGFIGSLAPAVNIGVDQSIFMGTSASFTPTVTIDRLSPTTTYLWSLVSGPGTPTFSPGATTLNVSVTFSEPGTYVLQLAVSDGVKTGTDTVSIVVTQTVFLAAGTGGAGIHSADGITWQASVMVTAGNNTRSLFYRNGLWLAGSASGNIFTSTNGRTWTDRGIIFSGEQVEHFAFGAGLYVAVGGGNSTGKISTSPDGITWTPRTIGTSFIIRQVAFGASMFVCTGNNGSIPLVFSSPDGITWTARTNPFAAGPGGAQQALIFAGSQFIAAGFENATTRTLLMTSPDGITWTGNDITWPALNGVGGIGYESTTGTYVLVGRGGKIMTATVPLSPWTARTSGTSNDLWRVTYDATLDVLVAVGISGTVLTSPDGTTWTTRTSGYGSDLNVLTLAR